MFFVHQQVPGNFCYKTICINLRALIVEQIIKANNLCNPQCPVRFLYVLAPSCKIIINFVIEHLL